MNNRENLWPAWRDSFLAFSPDAIQQMIDNIEEWLERAAYLHWPTPFRPARDAEGPLWHSLKDIIETNPTRVHRYVLDSPHVDGPYLLLDAEHSGPDDRLLPLLTHLQDTWQFTLDQARNRMVQQWALIMEHHSRHQPHTWTDFFDPVLRQARELFLAPAGMVAITDENQQLLELVVHQGLSDPQFSFSLPRGRGTGWDAISKNQGLEAKKLEESSQTQELRDQALVAPWRLGPFRTGAIYLTWPSASILPANGASWLEYFAHHVDGMLGPYMLWWRQQQRNHFLELQQIQVQKSAAHIAQFLEAIDGPEPLANIQRVAESANLAFSLEDQWHNRLARTHYVPHTPPSQELILQGNAGRQPIAHLTVWFPYPEKNKRVSPIIRAMSHALTHAVEMDNQRILSLLRGTTRWLERTLNPESGDTTNAIHPPVSRNHSVIWVADWGGDDLDVVGLSRLFSRHEPIQMGFFDDCIFVFFPKDPPTLTPENFLGTLKELVNPRASMLVCQGPYSHVELVHVLRTSPDLLRKLTQQKPSASGTVFFRSRPGIEELVVDPSLHARLYDFAERWLGPLIALSPDQSAVLVQTLNRYLATGDLSDTARKLYVHPHTVRKRLERISSLLTHAQLDNPEHRLILGAATSIWLVTQGIHAPW